MRQTALAHRESNYSVSIVCAMQVSVKVGKAWSDFVLPDDDSRFCYITRRVMLYINQEIEDLYDLLASPVKSRGNTLFNRLQAWSILTAFNRVNRELEALNLQLDTSIDLDAIEIDFEKYCYVENWQQYKFTDEPKTELEKKSHRTEINLLSDYLPNGVEGYQVTPDVLGSFRQAMYQLCDEDRMSSRSLQKSLDNAFGQMMTLLTELHNKVLNPKPYHYAKLWTTLTDTYLDDEYVERYHEWFLDTGTPTIDDLKAKQKQEIYELLKTGFFRFAKKPTGREVKNRKLIITEDDLEVGCVIDNDFETECAKLDRMVEWKDGCILVINYERLGQYIYKNYKKLNEDDFFHIIDFDGMMDFIHEDMAKLKPALAKYLKRYQEQHAEELLKDIKTIFEPFKNYLKNGLRNTLVEEYLEKLLFDSDQKDEAKKMLGGHSRKKYCCSIAIALASTYIFKPENNGNEDLAKALYDGLMTDNKETLLRYLKDKANFNQALNSWTSSIMDDLKEHPFSRTQTGQSKNIIP